MTARFYALLVLAVLGMAPCCLNKAAAQDAETLETARVCESETLPSASNAERARECVGIVHATAERAVLHRRGYLAELRAYSPRATGRAVYEGREHIASMHPHRLPAVVGMRRELARVRFTALVVAAWRGLHGAEPPCAGVLEWGSPQCVACRRRMRAAGCVEVHGCGANAWFACGGGR